jgi:hypothetical protein
MADNKNNSGNRARKVMTALDGADEFSVFSVDPESHKRPMVKLDNDSASTGRPDDTRVSRSVVRFFRKIFGE